MPLHVSSTCAHHQEVKIALNSIWYHHTYRCDDSDEDSPHRLPCSQQSDTGPYDDPDEGNPHRLPCSQQSDTGPYDDTDEDNPHRLPCSQQSDTGPYDDPDEGSPHRLPCSQQSDTGPYDDPDEGSPHQYAASVRTRVRTSQFSPSSSVYFVPPTSIFVRGTGRLHPSFCTLSAHLLRGPLTGPLPSKPPHKISFECGSSGPCNVTNPIKSLHPNISVLKEEYPSATHITLLASDSPHSL